MKLHSFAWPPLTTSLLCWPVLACSSGHSCGLPTPSCSRTGTLLFGVPWPAHCMRSLPCWDLTAPLHSWARQFRWVYTCGVRACVCLCVFVSYSMHSHSLQSASFHDALSGPAAFLYLSSDLRSVDLCILWALWGVCAFCWLCAFCRCNAVGSVHLVSVMLHASRTAVLMASRHPWQMLYFLIVHTYSQTLSMQVHSCAHEQHPA